MIKWKLRNALVLRSTFVKSENLENCWNMLRRDANTFTIGKYLESITVFPHSHSPSSSTLSDPRIQSFGIKSVAWTFSSWFQCRLNQHTSMIKNYDLVLSLSWTQKGPNPQVIHQEFIQRKFFNVFLNVRANVMIYNYIFWVQSEFYLGF